MEAFLQFIYEARPWVVSTKKLDLTTKDHVIRELLPIIAEQFGVNIRSLTPQTRFKEDLQAD